VIGDDGERRLDKYGIPMEVSGEGAAPPPANEFEVAWSGKMVAFSLPIVSGLMVPVGGGSGYGCGRRDRGSFDRVTKPRALVLTPARELAAQVKVRGASLHATLARESPSLILDN
jgi:ATP-dependent RNA helicase DDX3X